MSSPPPSSQPSSSLVQRLFNSKANNQFDRFSRILSTSQGIEASLTLVEYAATLLHVQFERLVNAKLERLATTTAANASRTLSPGETLIATLTVPTPTVYLTELHGVAKALALLAAEARSFLRLWGLLGLWMWARRVALNGSRDVVLRAVEWTQIVANAGYLFFEYVAFLARKGVLSRVSEPRQARYWVLSGRFFAVHVVAEYVRLWRLRKLSSAWKADSEGDTRDSEKEAKSKEDKAAFWRALVINIAYTPMTLHWSMEGGCLSDSLFGFLGTVAGVVGFKEIWDESA